MIISLETLRKIRKIIDSRYNTLTISVLGNSVFTPEELRELRNAGIDTSNQDSFLDLVYNHNYLNQMGKTTNPVSVDEMQKQQAMPSIKPIGEAHIAAVEHLNENAKQSIEKLKQDMTSRVEGLIRSVNQDYKHDALQNLTRLDVEDEIVKESMVGKIKRDLRDYSTEPFRNWDRIVRTEISNAIGAGSVDRIVTDNKEKAISDVYVYRINPNDSATCKYCRSFYIDGDGSPKVYRLTSLLANGSNYGKKAPAWQGVSGATHPNCRDSQILELRRGWKVLPGGSVTFIGYDKWDEYISRKVVK